MHFKHGFCTLRRKFTESRTSPMDPIAQGGAMAIDPEHFYTMRGISTEGAANQQLVDLLRELCGRYSRNEDVPDIDAALAVVPTLKRALYCVARTVVPRQVPRKRCQHPQRWHQRTSRQWSSLGVPYRRTECSHFRRTVPHLVRQSNSLAGFRVNDKNFSGRRNPCKARQQGDAGASRRAIESPFEKVRRMATSRIKM
jgi:hypothetical protein